MKLLIDNFNGNASRTFTIAVATAYVEKQYEQSIIHIQYLQKLSFFPLQISSVIILLLLQSW